MGVRNVSTTLRPLPHGTTRKQASGGITITMFHTGTKSSGTTALGDSTTANAFPTTAITPVRNAVVNGDTAKRPLRLEGTSFSDHAALIFCIFFVCLRASGIRYHT